MDLIIPEETLHAAHLSADELRQEIAMLLFARERLTLGQAVRLAGMDRLTFQHVLASRRIEPHYGVEDLEEDHDTLRRLGRLS